MRRHPFILCAFLLTTFAAGGAHAQTLDATRPASAATADDRFLRFDNSAAGNGSTRAIVPEPATLGMIVLGGSALFYPRRRARLYR